MNSLRALTMTLILLGFQNHVSFGRPLSGRSGIGVSIQDFNSTPSISVRYHFGNYTTATFLAGFDSSEGTNSSILGAKLHKNIHLEENLNFYTGIGAYFIADKVTGTFANGIEFDGLFGAEFFLSGLPNLGLNFETGVALRTLRKVNFKSIGTGFGQAAIHYYF